MELEALRRALEIQSQATLQLANRVGALGVQAEQLSATTAVSSDANACSTLPNSKTLSSASEMEMPAPLAPQSIGDLDESEQLGVGRTASESEALHQMVSKRLHAKSYDVTNYYKKTGVCQAIARSQVFEVVSLALVIGSSLWMAVDVDFNDAAMLHQADIGFQVVGNAVCFLFTVELIIRFSAFENIRNVVKDFWCMFDLLLVIF